MKEQMRHFRTDVESGAAMGKMGVRGNSRSEAVPTRRNALKSVTYDATWESEDESLTSKAELRETRMPPILLSFFIGAAEAKGQPSRFLNDSNASDSSRRMKDSLSKAVRSRNVA